LASLTRETGPKVVKGDPARKGEAAAKGAPPTPQAHHQHHHPAAPTIAVSDSSLKFTHVLYNLSPAGKHRIACPLHNFFFKEARCVAMRETSC